MLVPRSSHIVIVGGGRLCCLSARQLIDRRAFLGLFATFWTICEGIFYILEIAIASSIAWYCSFPSTTSLIHVLQPHLTFSLLAEVSPVSAVHDRVSVALRADWIVTSRGYTKSLFVPRSTQGRPEATSQAFVAQVCPDWCSV